jgi:hypothetical protein
VTSFTAMTSAEARRAAEGCFLVRPPMSSSEGSKIALGWFSRSAIVTTARPTGMAPGPPGAACGGPLTVIIGIGATCPPVLYVLRGTSAGTSDLPVFREQSYHALSRQDAARRANLGTYRA